MIDLPDKIGHKSLTVESLSSGKQARRTMKKIRDSGMPNEDYWETLFDVPLIISRLRLGESHNVAELGCGYGTFSIPIAKAISGTLYSFDIEPEMVTRTLERAAELHIACVCRDVVADGFGVKADTVLLFNILHCDNPVQVLQRAVEALLPNGRVLVIHWQYGETPRGPSLEIRPRPEQIIAWAHEAGLSAQSEVIQLPPWHYGIILIASN